METTPQASAGLAETAWVAYEMSCRGALTMRWDGRANAGRRTTHTAVARSTRGRRIPRLRLCLVRRTGRPAGWREWRRNRARANKYSQEERVTSHHRPYAECYAMSNVIGFFPGVLTLRMKRQANLIADHGAVGQDCDVLQHRLATIAEGRRLHGMYERAHALRRSGRSRLSISG